MGEIKNDMRLALKISADRNKELTTKIKSWLKQNCATPMNKNEYRDLLERFSLSIGKDERQTDEQIVSTHWNAFVLFCMEEGTVN